MKKTTSSGYFLGFPLLNVLILITAIALMVCLGYGLNSWLRGEENIRWVAPDPGCDLHAATCHASLGDAGFTFSVDADGAIEALTALPLEVKVEGVEASQVSVEFVGRDMEMGLHRFTLVATAPGHFNGQGQVGLCTQRVMPWRARVILSTPEGKIGSWFDFDVTRS
ncbi:hypothetical protein [Vreelandella malpeensis]|uniref:Uncharacterized protein n=1 Tax=Vreelandella malpeensis TaxID=1172368 RepID=A0ABS8DSP9_9GAMM|nr:hypothetical protein [Halomonas malpeensis]MCB8889352.1 hypothetical protein [Halomonas malpeensis]